MEIQLDYYKRKADDVELYGASKVWMRKPIIRHYCAGGALFLALESNAKHSAAKLRAASNR